MPKTSETHESPASQAPQASGSAQADAVPTLWTERLLLEPVTLEFRTNTRQPVTESISMEFSTDPVNWEGRPLPAGAVALDRYRLREGGRRPHCGAALVRRPWLGPRQYRCPRAACAARDV